jgi:hypothetical protein
MPAGSSAGAARKSAGWVSVKERDASIGRIQSIREFSSLGGQAAGLHTVEYWKSFTAAVEKIPLSVV